MRSTIFAWPAAFVLASLVALGCKTNVAVDPDPDPDPDPKTCEEPKPDIPSDSWCPPAYECIDGEWVDTAGACPEPDCPASKPADGAPCELPGQVCSYEEDIPCGPVEQVDVYCTSGGWLAPYNFCLPEPECPDILPVAGTNCTGWDFAYACQYMVQTGCGEEMLFVSCTLTETDGMVWTVEAPSTCDVCKGYESEATCAASKECMWLTPGCGDEPIQTGCYPKTGCDAAGCDDGSVCVETTYNPCVYEPCDACASSYFACLPGWAP